MAYDIFERISTSELMDFTNEYQPSFNFFATYLPEVRTSAEYLEVIDYDVDYNPPAEVVGDNTVAPVLQRPDYAGKVQTLETYKIKHVLSDSEIRKIEKAETNRAKQEAMRLVFNDASRLSNGHAIAREIWRARALFDGKMDFADENFKPAPYDYGLPQDQIKDIDLTTDDILEKLASANKVISDRTGKTLGIWLLSNESIFKLQGNESLRSAVFGSQNVDARRLTRDEVSNVLRSYAGIEIRPIQDENGNNYHYTDKYGKQVLFVPIEESILLPTIPLGNTVIGETSEELVLGREGYKLTNNNGVIMFPKYDPTPVHFELNSVSRFTVVYPKANCSFKFKDTSDPIASIYNVKGPAIAKPKSTATKTTQDK